MSDGTRAANHLHLHLHLHLHTRSLVGYCMRAKRRREHAGLSVGWRGILHHASCWMDPVVWYTIPPMGMEMNGWTDGDGDGEGDGEGDGDGDGNGNGDADADGEGSGIADFRMIKL